LLLFSLQLGDGAAWQLATDGRYRHGPAGLRAALAAAGLEVVEWREEVLRQEAGADVPGLLIVARARGH
jgi:predicted TPR repeat methyltransferase